MNRTSCQKLVAYTVLLAIGMVIGAALHAPNQAQAEIRATPTPPAFQSGGQMSVPVLKEIAATLHQIDGRLARLEAAAQKLQTQKPGATTAN